MVETDVKLGQVGDLGLSFSKGKAMITVSGAIDGGAVGVKLSVEVGADLLVDQIAKAVDKVLPAETKIDEAIFAAIKMALMAVE